jgi:hypothetical protein
MNSTYVIPVAVNPYNGSLENVICNVSKGMGPIARYETKIKGVPGDGYHIYINDDFMDFSKVAQRFMLLEQFAKLCYDMAKSHLCEDSELRAEMEATSERVISVNVIDHMIALYGTYAIEDAISELYTNDYFSFIGKRIYKELLRMHTYGDPYDVRTLRDKMALVNGAKCNLEDVRSIFICKDDKFDITTVKYEKF